MGEAAGEKSFINNIIQRVIGIILILIVLFSIIWLLDRFGIIHLPGSKCRYRHQCQLAACESNLKNIATALEMYATDYGGNYPSSLSLLTSTFVSQYGAYMKALPSCPSVTTAYYGYAVANNPDNFTLWCGGLNSHLKPQFTLSEKLENAWNWFLYNFSPKYVIHNGCWPQYTPSEGIKLKP